MPRYQVRPPASKPPLRETLITLLIAVGLFDLAGVIAYAILFYFPR
jgi:hypothetical protein